jgi:hypothetical protein
MSRAMSLAAATARGPFSPSVPTSRARYASFALSAACTVRCRASSCGSTPLRIIVADSASPSSSVRARPRSLASKRGGRRAVLLEQVDLQREIVADGRQVRRPQMRVDHRAAAGLDDPRGLAGGVDGLGCAAAHLERARADVVRLRLAVAIARPAGASAAPRPLSRAPRRPRRV